MTVRWKPLLILSGLFLVVALIGVVAIAVTLVPQSSQGTLKLARAAQEAGRFENAEIYFRQALQVEPRNAEIHEQFAGLYRDWAGHAPAEKQAELRGKWLEQLASAVKYDKAGKGPRRELLRDAMIQDLAPESVYWARELLNVEPENADAHYVLAAEALEERTPNVPEIRRHLEVLDQVQAPVVRRLWIRARLAEATGDAPARDAALGEARAIALGSEADAVDRTALLRLTALAIRSEPEWPRLAAGVQRLRDQLKALGKPEELAPGRLGRLRLLLEQTQRALAAQSAKLPPAGKTAIDGLVNAIEVDLDSVFQQALSEGHNPDLQTYLSYADHLRVRKQPQRCLEVTDRGLRAAQAARRPPVHVVMTLHLVAAEMILSRADDAQRFVTADPHIQALLSCPDPRFQALGHLLAGSIDLDRSGLARDLTTAAATATPTATAAGPAGATTNRPAPPKLRASALNHLKIAATALPDIAEAQARYGVALVLAQEQNLGRQYLQNALRLGSLDPQYQVWTAWTILQAGYPEEAEPLVQALIHQVEQGNLPRELEGTLHLLRGELYQARRGPEDLKKAIAEFDQALAAGQIATPTVIMRLAQIDVQLGQHDRALERLRPLRASGQGGAAAEQLAVLTLEEQGKTTQARELIRQARARYPRSPELAGLAAAFLAKDGQPGAADQLLDEFLRDHPEDFNLVMMRAQIRAEALKDPDTARTLLQAVADRVDSSAPLVQLAGLEIDKDRLDAAAAVVTKIRARWKEAAAADVLEAQIALKRGKIPEALQHFNTALKKDPDNKIVRFWKAKLDARTGAVDEATRALEAIVRNKPVKEVDPGITLLSAAQSALANLSLQTHDLDTAIRRFEELKRSSQTGRLSRSDRWQLITAYVAKGQWPAARSALAAILNDRKDPPSDEERVRGANFYRQQGENAAALAQLDYVLQVHPTNPSAVVSRAYILLQTKQPAQAAALLRRAIERTAQDRKEPPPAVFYLMLAAVENETPPAATAVKRALAVLDAGLQQQPLALELVQAKYLALVAAGDSRGALALVEAKAQEDPKGPFRRLLVEKCREQGNFARAEAVLTELHQEFPEESNLAAALVQVVSLQAAEAGAHHQPDRQRQLDDKAAALIREYRSRYPNDLIFLQTECDMAARRGDFTRALAVTHEIDKVGTGGSLGPLLRARIFGILGRTQDLAQAYTEALDRERSPRQWELRVLLGQARLQLGEVDEALRQARLVLAVEKNRSDAILLQARALAQSGASANERRARSQEAVAQLEEVIRAKPTFVEAHHALAEIHRTRGDRAAAIAAWKADLRANPDDAAAVGQLIQLLAEHRPSGQAQAAAADLAEVRRLAAETARRDSKGSMILAIAVGLHKAGQLELALPYAQAAAERLKSPAAHLNLGDLLLTIAESQSDRTTARATFLRAVEQYDRVLQAQPSSVEAVNNKAWILHTYLEQSPKALDLVLDLQKRVNAAALPGEFFDTLGSILESLGRTREAEQAYLDGLKKAPENPVLNFHYGRLITTDRHRAARARTYLDKALASRDRLSPFMAQEADRLVRDPASSP
ncbi:MAG TPA: tetratricopeptide repeat protein [Isosphaeraceae bacterium]|nr:tetratricopeptide repeat protein [Isosphaeraceae bacterium]